MGRGVKKKEKSARCVGEQTGQLKLRDRRGKTNNGLVMGLGIQPYERVSGLG